jgi:ABC-2 type transport system permease protein
MSVAEAPVVAPDSGVVRPPLVGTRFFRSELMLIFGRRRNWVGLAVLALPPVILAIAVKATADNPRNGGGLVNSILSNGLFVALAALTLEAPLFLPVAVAAIAGDTVAGEANLGTLRYLLTVPVHRTRLLVVKFGALMVFTATATLLVATVGVLVGLPLFGGGDLLTLSGTTIPFWHAVVRLVLICGYLTAFLISLGAIGLFISTLTEQPIGATIALLLLTITSEILDQIPQLHSIHRYLPTHYWLNFDGLLRDPADYGALVPGLFCALAYTVIFTTAAWARFTTKDISG